MLASFVTCISLIKKGLKNFAWNALENRHSDVSQQEQMKYDHNIYLYDFILPA